MNITRRRFIQGGLLAAGGSLGVIKLHSTFDLEVKRYTLSLPSFISSRPLRIAHLSDLHASDTVPFNYLEKVIQQTLDLAPDLICLTGDFVSKDIPQPDTYTTILKQLSDTLPCFAVTGNHDGGTWAAKRKGFPSSARVVNLLRNAGIDVINNASRTLTLNNQPIHITGLGDLWAEEFHPRQAFSSQPPDGPHIVLSHNPDTKDALRDYSWDLMLSGHTHGGQLRIPFLGAPLAPVHDHRYTEGLHRWRDRHLCISKGVGNLHRIRINCPPDIGLIKITS